MKVVFHLSTPKDALFFRPLADRLVARGHEVRHLSRGYTELDAAAEALGLEVQRIGRHGGADLLSKLLCSAERIEPIARFFEREKPDVAVILFNHECARVAFGLGVPLVCFNDLPEYDATSRLTLPLATRVFAPWLIPAETFARFGVEPERLSHYRALDPLAWLSEHDVDPAVRTKLGLREDAPLVLCRETEWQSGYARVDVVADLGEALARRHPDWQVFSIPRYEPHPFYDVPSLLSQAALLVGGGGTMCVEAAYHGTPVVATRDLDCRYMRWLFDQDLAIEARDRADALRVAEAWMAGRTPQRADAWRRRARAAFDGMRFPFDALVDGILACAKGR